MLCRFQQAVVAAHMAETKNLAYIEPLRAFAALREAMPHAVWLDGEQGGQYSIVTAAPRLLLVYDGQRTVGTADDGTVWTSAEDPLALLAEALGPTQQGPAPFFGGAIGYFSYELGRRLQGQTPPLTQSPEMAVGLYDWALVIDHQAGTATLNGNAPSHLPRLLAQTTAQPGAWQVDQRVEAIPDSADYARAFDRIKHYLRDGDCYQVNLARQFRRRFQGDPLGVYAQFRGLAGGPFSAYLDLPGGPVLSGSPERFLKLRDGVVETRPIKGTRRRSSDPEEDARLAQALLSSEKDRAENVMIVDLLRNDISRACATGSVSVPQLFALESYATVHHMVSVVTGRIAPEHNATDLLRDCLPGGSITGAPKFRAMEIIAELEHAPRGVYCGAIGYIGYDGVMDTNIAIRTINARDGWLDYRAGGGLVYDSECSAEFAETEFKAAAFVDVMIKSTAGRKQAQGEKNE